MRKNGSRLISIQQYKATDLFLFALILIVFEVLNFFAVTKWFVGAAFFTFSLAIPICVVVMMRWGWISIIYAVCDGLFYCLMLCIQYNQSGNIFEWFRWIQYGIGGAFIALTMVYFHFVGKERIRQSWWLSALSVVIAWISVMLGRSIMYSACTGENFVGVLLSILSTDVLSMVIGVVVILVLRKLDGMFEDQKLYLARLDKEKRDKMQRDTFGDGPVEINEELLSAFNDNNDLY